MGLSIFTPYPLKLDTKAERYMYIEIFIGASWILHSFINILVIDNTY